MRKRLNKRPARKPTPKPGVYPSQPALAKRLGISQPRVCELTQAQWWTWGKAPWTEAQAVEIEAALKVHRALNNNAPDSAADDPDSQDDLSDIAKAKLKVLVQRGVKLELENQAFLGGYVKKEDVEQERVARVQAVTAELRNIRLLALKMEGQSLQERERILESWARDVCRKFAGN